MSCEKFIGTLFLARDARSSNPGSPEQEALARDFADNANAQSWTWERLAPNNAFG